jgi:acyl dehydratase
MAIDLASAEPGNVLGVLRVEPITRHMLALYCGASGDHNPLHVDIDAARRGGLDDVIAHGMLSMAHLGRLLNSITRPENLREFGVRFCAPVNIGDALSCTATLAARRAVTNLLEIDLVGRCQAGNVKVTGRAIISYDEEGARAARHAIQ